MDAIELLRKQQAENRARSVKPTQSISELYRYIGFDAESGMAIVSNGSDTIQAGRITNGAIKPNQPVKVLQANNRAVIDSMPAPKPALPVTTSQTSYPIKLVSAKREGNRIEYFVTAIALSGQCKFNPRPVYTFEVEDNLQSERMFCQIDSTGQKEEDWILSVAHVYGKDAIGNGDTVPTDVFRIRLRVDFQKATFAIATIRRNRSWELNSQDDPKLTALFWSTGDYPGSFYKGYGFWAIANCYFDQFWRSWGAPLNDALSFAWHEGERTETSSGFFVLPNVAISFPEFLPLQVSYCNLQTALVVGLSSVVSEGIEPKNNLTDFKQSNLIVSQDVQEAMPLNNTIQNIDVNVMSERFDSIDLDFNLLNLTGYGTRANYVRNALYTVFEPSIHLPRTVEGAKRRQLLLHEFSRQDSFILRRRRIVNINLPIPDDHLRIIPLISLSNTPTIETLSASYYP